MRIVPVLLTLSLSAFAFQAQNPGMTAAQQSQQAAQAAQQAAQDAMRTSEEAAHQ